MDVVAITIAAIIAVTFVLVIVILNFHSHNTFKRTVQKFRIYLSKKIKVDDPLLVMSFYHQMNCEVVGSTPPPGPSLTARKLWH